MPRYGAFAGLALLPLAAAAEAPRSHPPMRPLPAATDRPRPAGPVRFIDPARGDNAHDGSEAHPWRTFAHAVPLLNPGDTLCLRGGVYREPLTLDRSGEPGRPVTVRAHPGELAVLDGGIAEFLDDPAGAWEPAPGGASDEVRSVREYPGFERVCGHFADSMVPLYPYRWVTDLRAANEYWLGGAVKVSAEAPVYCGPGVAYDTATRRIHARLAHTNMVVPSDLESTYAPYRGETDPRKLPLVVAGGGPVLRLAGARHVRVQDLVVRGAAGATVDIADCADVELDGLTVYGGAPALRIAGTERLRLSNTAVRGLCAPWAFRTIKYRGPSPYLVVARDGKRRNAAFEIAFCEFTDSHDFLLPSIVGLDFHHNLVDNHNDDGIYLSGEPPNRDFRIHENRLSRCLTLFSFYDHASMHGVPGGMARGSGARIYRNVIDLRPPVHYGHPRGPGEGEGGQGRLGGDHGGPVWEPMTAYHNTVLLGRGTDRRTAPVLWGGHTKATERRVFNNLFVQIEGVPAFPFPPAADDFQADGNLHWTLKGDAAAGRAALDTFRASKAFAASRTRYAPGWAAGDVFADPLFTAFDADWRKPSDLRLRDGSPAADAGVALPAEWPDPLRESDAGKPDIGAIPRGARPWTVGVGGRYSVFP